MGYDPANPQGQSGASPFDSARNQVNQRAQGQQRQQSDAMQRRLASMGMQNSGAAITSQQDIDRGIAQDRENALGNIDLEQEKQSIPFALQSSQQGFEAGESAKGRQQQKEMQERDIGQQNVALQQQQGQFTQSQGQQQRQFNVTSDMEKQAQDYNISLSQFESGQKSNPFSGSNMGKYLGGIIGGGAGAGLGALFSDRRMKKNLIKLDQSLYKHVPTYIFEYKDPQHGEGQRLGVLAQDLLNHNPYHPAVIETNEGYMVDYSQVEEA